MRNLPKHKILNSQFSILNSRKGVTLLLVLSLMTMFSMLIVTFMMVTTNARQTAQTVAMAVLNPPEQQYESSAMTLRTNMATAIEKLLVGDDLSDPGAFVGIGPFSVLENLYGHPVFDGNDFLRGTFGTISAVGTDDPDNPNDAIVWVTESPFAGGTLRDADFFFPDFVGHVLTVTGTPHSTAIIDICDENDNMILAPFEDGYQPQDGNAYIINSPAHGGTGVLADANEYAFKPRALAQNIDELNGKRVLLNPDYTAPDYRNLFLAWNDTSGNRVNHVKPSFHDPSLVKYALDNGGDWRDVVMRPAPQDHPNFNTNPAATAANWNNFLQNGPWDVDNDGDGIADSIWFNIGLPTQKMDGKTYQPLVAYYVLDMDGRLNLNVHGNKKLNDAALEDSSTHEDWQYAETAGVGMGPAEVRLEGLGIDDQETRQILNSRYGEGDNPGSDKSGNALVTGVDGDAPWWTSPIAMLGINPWSYGNPLVNNGRFGSLRPDLWGVKQLIYNRQGIRYFGQQVENNDNLYKDNPYLMNPYSDADGDEPFSTAELQYMLRSVGDTDFANLPERLREILEDDNDAGRLDHRFSSFRQRVTTRSSSLPVTTRLNAKDGTGLFRKLYTAVGEDNEKFLTIYKALPAELRRGENINVNKLTLSRNWGNDDPAPDVHNALLLEKARFAQSIFYTLLLLSYEEIYTGITDDTLRSEAVRRLAQWSVNFVDFIDPDATNTPFIYKEKPFGADVDSYDNKNEMDIVMGTGDDLTIDLADTEGFRLVWGMEKPELALTETLALHNRGVADRITEKGLKCTEENCPFHPDQIANNNCLGTHDKTYDQVIVPQPSLYFEVFRNWDGDRHYYTSDIYTTDDEDNDQWDAAIDLAKTTEAGVPVYRYVTTSKTVEEPSFDWNDTERTEDLLKNDVLWQTSQITKGANRTQYVIQTVQWPGETPVNNEIAIERVGFFTDMENFDLSGVTLPSETEFNVADIFCNRNDAAGDPNLYPPPMLMPGQYLVVGPREETNLLSEEADGVDVLFGTPEMTRNPDTNLAYHTLILSELKPTNPADPPAIHMISGAQLPAEWTADDSQWIGLNVTAPLPASGNYYAQPTTGRIDYALEECPTEPYTLAGGEEELHMFGTIPAYSTILLQRLADPRRPYHAVKNPYITIDWQMVDVQVFSSEQAILEDPKAEERETEIAEEGSSKISDPTRVWEWDETIVDDAITADKVVDQPRIFFGSRQWGRDNPLNSAVTHPNPWSRVYVEGDVTGDNADTIKKLAGLNVGEEVLLTNDFTLDEIVSRDNIDLYRFPEMPPENTFGWKNRDDKDYNNRAELHFPWHDAPLNNSGEVMMIPTSNAASFGLEFYDTGTQNRGNTDGMPASLGSPRFFHPDIKKGPYLDFFVADSLPLTQFLDMIYVPSRFKGSIRGWAGDGTAVLPVYSMREPGKININTANESAWEGLKGHAQDWIGYDELQTKRGSNRGDEATDVNFQTPFRSPQTANLVPVETDAEKWRGSSTLDEEVFPRNSEGKGIGDLDLNPYTAVEKTMQMRDLVTTRSNVFAVWITIGFFEVDPTNGELGQEKGLTDGTVKRQRAFYLIDRTTPVGFRRGNSRLGHENVIVTRTFLE